MGHVQYETAVLDNFRDITLDSKEILTILVINLGVFVFINRQNIKLRSSVLLGYRMTQICIHIAKVFTVVVQY